MWEEHTCVASHTPNHTEPTFIILSLIPLHVDLYIELVISSTPNFFVIQVVTFYSLTSKTSKEIWAYQLSRIRTWPSISQIEGTLHPEACWRWLQPSTERRKVHAKSETKREGNVLPLHPQKMGRLVYKLDMMATALILWQNVAYWFICLTFFKRLRGLHVNVNMYRRRGSSNWTENILDRNILCIISKRNYLIIAKKGKGEFLNERFQQDISV